MATVNDTYSDLDIARSLPTYGPVATAVSLPPSLPPSLLPSLPPSLAVSSLCHSHLHTQGYSALTLGMLTFSGESRLMVLSL